MEYECKKNESEREWAEKEAQIRQTREDLERTQKTRVEYQDNHRDAWFQTPKNFWNDEVRSEDKEIDKEASHLAGSGE
jgi:hypothetical protein